MNKNIILTMLHRSLFKKQCFVVHLSLNKNNIKTAMWKIAYY